MERAKRSDQYPSRANRARKTREKAKRPSSSINHSHTLCFLCYALNLNRLPESPVPSVTSPDKFKRSERARCRRELAIRGEGGSMAEQGDSEPHSLARGHPHSSHYPPTASQSAPDRPRELVLLLPPPETDANHFVPVQLHRRFHELSQSFLSMS
jgi:hypothetical protein